MFSLTSIDPSLQSFAMKGLEALTYLINGFMNPLCLSEKSLPALAKHVHHELLPALAEGEEGNAVFSSPVLPIHLVETAIKLTLTRVNYGLEMPLGVRVPASLCIWRWEVKDEYRDWLPKAAKEMIEVRSAERIQVRAQRCHSESLY
jgi:chromatin assembly factor 1 subunit A